MDKINDLKKKIYNDQYKLLENFMNQTHPGWKKDKKVVKSIHKAAQETVDNIFLNIKKKVIRKSDYNGEWPFISDKIIICKRGKLKINCLVTCFIKNKEYALTGETQQVLIWLKFPHEAGKAIKGKDVGPFIRIGMEL